MKTKELIEILQKQDPELPVMIEQEEFEYLTAHSVYTTTLEDPDEEPFDAVVIDWS